MNNWRLSCQVKVKDDLSIVLPEEIFGIKEWECEVISTEMWHHLLKNSWLSYLKVRLLTLSRVHTARLEFQNLMQLNILILILTRNLNQSGINLRCGIWFVKVMKILRAYSMANFPAEGNIITLNVRVATPPFDRAKGTWMNVNPGIVSSYIFNLKPGDKVMMSGPYGEFHPILDSKREMLWIGGGAGMAPLRSQIMHLLKTLRITDRKMSFFYGARALIEAFYLEDFYELEREFPNFSFHLALDRPDPKADEAGIKYTPGFVHQVIYDTYLKDHDAPEDIEYYMCGPGPMANAAQRMLDSLGVPKEMIMFDDFG